MKTDTLSNEKVTPNGVNNVLYAVMKLDKKIDITINGIVYVEVIEGIEGFIPVFNTVESAEKASVNGKFEIIPISIK